MLPWEGARGCGDHMAGSPAPSVQALDVHEPHRPCALARREERAELIQRPCQPPTPRWRQLAAFGTAAEQRAPRYVSRTHHHGRSDK